MPINQLYHTWFQRLRQLRPTERVTRLRNAAWMLTGIFESRSVHLRRIADKIPGIATTPSKERRLAWTMLPFGSGLGTNPSPATCCSVWPRRAWKFG